MHIETLRGVETHAQHMRENELQELYANGLIEPCYTNGWRITEKGTALLDEVDLIVKAKGDNDE